MTAGGNGHDAAAGRVVQAGEVRLARLESLRALAALAVLVGHVWGGYHLYAPDAVLATFEKRLLLNGGMGVFLFFALSGYLLFWPFVRRHWGDGHRIDLRVYARNRALRILPLYWIAIVVLMLLSDQRGDATLWWRHLLFVQGMWSDSVNAIDGPLWSVAVEIQFYVLLPLIAWALAVLSRRRVDVAIALLLALGVLSAYARWRLAIDTDDPRNPWAYQFATTFHFFVAGMVLALLRLRLRDRELPLPAGLLVLASAGCWLLVTWHLDQDFWMAPAGFLLVGALVLPLRRGRWAAWLDWKPLALVGVASYSLYVWHMPLGDFLDWGRGDLEPFVVALVAITAAAIAVALVSYRLIEAPFLRLRRQWAQR